MTEPRPALMPPPVARPEESALLVALDEASPKHWCVWSWEPRDDRWTKVPRTWRGGQLHNARSNAPSTWLPLEAAFAAWRDRPHVDIHGLGHVLDGGGTVFIDLDGCVAEQAPLRLAPWAAQIVERYRLAWEVSPSGKGVKGWGRAKLPWNGRRQVLHHIEPVNSTDPGLEVWGNLKYGCITLRPLQPLTGAVDGLPQVQAEIDDLIERMFARVGTVPRLKLPDRLQHAHCARDVDWVIRHARAAKNGAKFSRLFGGDASGYPSSSEADLALAAIVAFWTTDAPVIAAVMRRSSLARDKWDQRRGGDDGTYLSTTIATALGRPELPRLPA